MAKSQEDSTTILLGLKGYQVGRVKEDSQWVIIEVRTIGKEVNCPYCGRKRLYRHGACPPRRVLHSWSNGKKIYLELYRQRWRCRDCGHTFFAMGESYYELTQG
jgi:transposase